MQETGKSRAAESQMMSDKHKKRPESLLVPGLLCLHLLDLLRFDLSFHHKIWRSKPCSFEKQVEIGPFKHQFGHMVHFGILE
jgi:hypothetical protein